MLLPSLQVESGKSHGRLNKSKIRFEIALSRDLTLRYDGYVQGAFPTRSKFRFTGCGFLGFLLLNFRCGSGGVQFDLPLAQLEGQFNERIQFHS